MLGLKEAVGKTPMFELAGGAVSVPGNREELGGGNREFGGRGGAETHAGRRRFCGARKEMEGDTVKEMREEKFL